MTDKPFKIIEEFGVLSETESGWQKIMATVSWYGKEPKFDIRTYNPDKTRTSKGGITLTIQEAKKLKEILNGLEL